MNTHKDDESSRSVRRWTADYWVLNLVLMIIGSVITTGVIGLWSLSANIATLTTKVSAIETATTGLNVDTRSMLTRLGVLEVRVNAIETRQKGKEQ